ncbi:MAG: hypothetical protein B7Z73_01045 [Planctomycetia bacterium 21-64-5]|nr:MAG: hypothetical protein B7Z73_01045 [Planctomycetia bacterium 21-64-5]HQU42138.1 hypothetical protein [Pirellulales bacterium]
MAANWLAEATVLASCGDYVMVGGHAQHGHLPAGHFAPVPADPDRHAAAGHRGEQLPCHGPNCSRRSAPDPQPPVTPPNHHHDWGWTADATPEVAVKPLGFVIWQPIPATLLRTDLVFRPPRRTGHAVVG